MATQRSIQKRTVAFQGEMREAFEQILTLLAELQEEVHETKLAILRVEKKQKEQKNED